jgi:drug/metabolite transporter (DMT)-like permease
MQPSNQNDDLQAKIDGRFRSISTIWFGLFLSVGLYYLLTLYTGNPHEDVSHNRRLFLALAAAGVLLVIISVLIKQKFLKQSVDEQRVELVQTGYTVAWAISEVAALLGLLDFFLTGNRHYYVLFIIAACGHLLNFPRRQHLLDASFKSTEF